MAEAYLVLQDRQVFTGEAFGAWPAEADEEAAHLGEVVFNTSMSGYQEMVTDPSYAGQILVFTHPQIGNYGWHDEENESEKNLLRGIVVRELSGGEGSSHADRSLDEYCLRKGIRGLKGVDTRALTRHIRRHGTLPGVFALKQETGLEFWSKWESKSDQSGFAYRQITDLQLNSPEQTGKLNTAPADHWVYQATVRDISEIPGPGPLLAVMDFGAKRNILRELHKMGFRLLVFPAWTPAEDILDYHPAGLVLSNGPGDPSGLPEIVANIRLLIPRLPVLGICLGHQLLALAAGGTTYKLPFGHRGGNHPVQDARTGKTTMTAQNHGYAVLEESLPGSGFEVILRNLNDQTVEGMEHLNYPVFSVQYHPEAAPGPEENSWIFERFSKLVGMGDRIQNSGDRSQNKGDGNRS